MLYLKNIKSRQALITSRLANFGLPVLHVVGFANASADFCGCHDRNPQIIGLLLVGGQLLHLQQQSVDLIVYQLALLVFEQVWAGIL